MDQIQRTYSVSDAAMLTAVATIADHALEIKDFLIEKRPGWADPFFPDMKKEIDETFNNVLGVDNSIALRNSTFKINKLESEVMNLLSDLKVQIKEDFKDDKIQRNQVFTAIGLMSNGKFIRINNLDQQQKSQLLQSFKSGFTPELKAEIEKRGTSPAITDKLLKLADEYYQANILQEKNKGQSKTLNKETVEKLNALYQKVMSVAKITRVFLKGQSKAERDKFSFKAIVRQQGIDRPKKEEK